jgi:hypothetical protein
MNGIAGYVRRLNSIDSRDMTVNEVISYLTNEYKELSFTVFASEYISDMISHNREHPALNYRMAVKRLHEYMNRDNIFFSDITANILRDWIDGMMDSQRKRNLYPICIKAIFNAAMLTVTVSYASCNRTSITVPLTVTVSRITRSMGTYSLTVRQDTARAKSSNIHAVRLISAILKRGYTFIIFDKAITTAFIDMDDLLLITKKKYRTPHSCPKFTGYFGQVFYL